MLQASEILNASILIVDDQEANVMLLEQMLHSAGYTRIVTTMDPRAVHALHTAQRFDLILLDLQMPEMDGFEVMDGLRGIEPDGYLPVLVITAQPGHKLRALQAGAKDFVSKPFDLVEVKTRIHNMLEVRLLYRKLDDYNKVLEQTVLERTAELRESEARFQRFTELSSDWYWEQDAQGKLTKFSGPVQEMLGIGAEAGDAGVMAGRWNADERALLNDNIANRRPFLDFIYSRVNADNSIQYLQVSGEPMFDAGSRFAGYRGIGMDVTERMRPNREQLRFRGAIDALEVGICLLDPATLRVVDANETACAMSGYSRQELYALDMADLGVGDGAQLQQRFNALLAGGPVHLQSAELRHKSGAILPAAINWRAVQSGGKWVIVGVIARVGA
ncbi:PAS domain S-box-containing protein [Janthinobacterium sp. CG_23.3]|uniref:response regulator n=1 Tax=unclassified Janthinobacterium TaxID=2610881 RepID=UPI0003485ADF|nr:response regulator [Janthinobacterium sp. CG_S6]MEC5161555.1 PAS domain S-box-containing protein [Janthinobacterium sp. CG_S6]